METVTAANARQHLRLDIPCCKMTDHEIGLADLIARAAGHSSFTATANALGLWPVRVEQALDLIENDAE